MSRTLSDEDVEAIARNVVALIGGRLAAVPEAIPRSKIECESESSGGIPSVTPKLAYTARELCAELSISRDTIYRLESCGRLKAMPGIRRKIFSRAEVDRLLKGDRADWQRQ